MFRHNYRVTVLERDRSPDARPPGGTLDLHARLGQLALDKAGLLPEFQARSRPEGQAMRILDTDGAMLRDWRPAPADSANPEIDRGQLRDLLMDSLDIQWGRAVERLSPRTGDGMVVDFADGQREVFDLVVGADGAWSRVRSAVSPATPHYTGVTLVETSLDNVDSFHPDLAKLIGDGSVATYGVNRALVAQRNSGGHVKVYAQFPAPLDWHKDLDMADADTVRSRLLDLYDGWASPTLDLLRRGTAFACRPLDVMPAAHTWPHVAGVTLIGDAAHLMPPLGVGANLALLEGAELAEAIATSNEDIDETVRVYEEHMWARAGRWAKIAAEGLERLVSPDPSEALALFDAVNPS